MEYIIETRNLTKKYGKHFAADGVNLHVKRGEIYGFIGTNGAGKTTCMKMICGLAEQSKGEIMLFGKTEDESHALRERIGSLIEEPGLYYDMTAYQNMKCKCKLSGIRDYSCIEEILKLVDLQNTGKKTVKQFSFGMRQRLGIALALVGNPDVLILDEPINGLDPQGIARIREILVKLRDEKNLTIMVSSHILEELSKIADTFGIIHRGKLIEEISREELLSRCQNHVEINTDNPQRACVILEESGIKEFKVTDSQTLNIMGHLDETAQINELLVGNGCKIKQLKIVSVDIEDYYFEKTSGGAEK